MKILNIDLKNVLLLVLAVSTVLTQAGNGDKRGSAGGTEVLMNPWAKSSGYAGANVAGITGIEAMRFNVAGITDTIGLNLAYSYSQFMAGSETSTGAFGLTKSVGKNGTIGVSLMSNQLGDFIETTEELPEGTGLVFSPNYFNLGIAYAKRFSNSIKGGILIRVISESIQNVSATGVAFDAGIQYEPVATEKNPNADRFRFGVSLRNVGSTMRFSGDGLSEKGQFGGQTYERSLLSKSESFELPTALYIGLAYDVLRDSTHEITAMATFNSNSFTEDRYQFGGEYTFRNMVSLRLGFDYYRGLYDADAVSKIDAHGGPTAGVTVKKAYGDTGRQYGIDYAYRHTNVFGGTHSIGLSLDF